MGEITSSSEHDVTVKVPVNNNSKLNKCIFLFINKLFVHLK